MGNNTSGHQSETADADWYWDLEKKVAVRADNRGPGDQTLGPYASRAEAENWKATSASRNDIWETADEEWNDPTASKD